MKHIKKYKEYLTESKSISDITVEYTNILWDDISTLIENVKNDTESLNMIYLKRYNKIYTLNDTQFKIKDLQVDIKIHKFKSNVCNGVADMQNISYDDNDVLYYPLLKLEIYFTEFDDDFERYIKSVVLHEMVHIYQVYNMRSKKMDSNWHIGNTIISTKNKINNVYVKQLSNILYRASEHEIMAQLHQYFLYISEYNKPYPYIFDIQKSLSEFDTSKYVIDADFIKDLNIFRYVYNKRTEINKPNNKYYRNVSFVWKKVITYDNVHKFLKYVEDFVGKSLLFLNKKMKRVEEKCEIIEEGYDPHGYMRYINFLTE